LRKVPGKGEFLVTFSDGTELRVLKDRIAESGIEEGLSVSRERIAELDAEYAYARARQAALRLLRVRPRTELELRRRFSALDCGPVTVRRVIADLKSEGQIDDRIFARLWVREKLQRGDSGRIKIRRDLEAKGISREVIADELRRFFSDDDEARVAEALAVKKIGRLAGTSGSEAMRRVYTHLLRRGFTSDTASGAARRAAEIAGRTDDDEI
jgi:regulatory protein